MAKPKNIVRIDIPKRKTHGWQVRITRCRKRHNLFIADAWYGSSQEAYAAAEQYRDQLLKELPEPLSGAEVAAKVRSTSGVPGIRLNYAEGHPQIAADTILADRTRSVKHFSIKKWGLQIALRKACMWKVEMDPRLGCVGPCIDELFETAYENISKQLDQGGVPVRVKAAESVEFPEKNLGANLMRRSERMEKQVTDPRPDQEARHGTPKGYRWRGRYAGLTLSGIKRLKEFEEENRVLNQLVAEQANDIQKLEIALRGK